jgi:hypothetical protein
MKNHINKGTKTMEFTDQEIAFLQKSNWILKQPKDFDDPQLEVIKRWVTKIVKACIHSKEYNEQLVKKWC